MKRSRLSGGALAVAALVAAMVASAAYGISTTAGQANFVSCISGSGSDGCASVVDVTNPSGIALADDESRVFVASPSDNGVAVMVRNRSTGALTQLQLVPNNKGGCTNETGANGCFDGRGLIGAHDVASVGSNAYIASPGSDAVAVLYKDGQIWRQPADNGKQLFCVSEPVSADCPAAGSPAPRAVAGATSVTGFGAYVYVGGPSSIGIFVRGTKGALGQRDGTAGCVKPGGASGCASGTISGTIVDMAIPRDGKTLYAVDSSSNLMVFQRNKTTGALTQLASPTVSNVTGLVGVATDLQGNATNVYVAGTNNAVGVFRRNTSTGTLTQLAAPDGCLNAAGSGGCTAAPRLTNIGALKRLVVYKTNRFAYVAGDNGIASFSRTKSGVHGGALAPLADPAGCTTATGDGGQCLDAGATTGGGLGGTTDIFSTGGGKHIYVAGTDADAVSTFHQG